jgi:hypothetical protein
MNTNLTRTQQWSTSSFGSSPNVSPTELAALGEHLDQCDGQRGPLFGLKCAGATLDRFLAPRVITVLVLFAIVSAIAGALLQ